MNTAMMLRGVIGVVVGAGIGYLVYKFVGCRTGACPLTGTPGISMAIWGAMGLLMALSK